MYVIHNGTLHQAGIDDVRFKARFIRRTSDMIRRYFLRMGNSLYGVSLSYEALQTNAEKVV